MKRGKRICKELKAVRRRIADENGIALDQPECTHTGDCSGTCPRCEAEVRYLEQALERRLRLGRAATVAGISLTLAACGGSGGSALAPDTPLPGDTSLPASGSDYPDDSLFVEGFEEEPEIPKECELTGIVGPTDDEDILVEGEIDVIDVQKENDTAGEDEVYVFPEEYPSFPGGEEALYKFIDDNLRYPEEAREVNVQGSVIIRFVVEKDGSISNAAIAREIGCGCGREALRVVNMMPRWKPGKQGAKPVRTEFILPVKFSLR